jgi:hypothetical protein
LRGTVTFTSADKCAFLLFQCFFNVVWVSGYCLMPTQQFFNYIMVILCSFALILRRSNKYQIYNLWFYLIWTRGMHRGSPRFLCCLTVFFPTCWNRGMSESSTYGKQRICCCNSVSTHFHVSWLSDFIFYPKPLYKSLHQSFFY